MQDGKEGFVQTIKQRVERLDDIPAMPELGQELLRLRNSPHAGVKELAEAVEKDPGLSAQILRYARLSIFGYGSKISSIQKAITLVLGFDMALHMALGLSVGSRLKMPAGGRIGRDAFWRHSVYSATLMQELSAVMPAETRPPAGLAYLAGLLHNIGFLILGHLHPHEFALVNDVFTQSRSGSIREIELQLLGVRHEQLGTWLMQAWDMPAEIIIATREHHYSDYDGQHAIYAKLALLTDRALARYDLGDGDNVELPKDALTSLGLSEEWVVGAVEKLLNISPELDTLVEQLAA